ncbi:unnamed protein product [Citrullus colocynthis]|uniref:Cyclic nucleotide-binding domain-containing protein n=1 Tax=Citrullus colocynthis TaxID=252529 RepID=A0ABP0Z9F5_9ROSI
MQRVEVIPGQIVIEQDGEGDCFYVVGSGDFEVLATQEESHGEVPWILQHYTAEKLSSFGELALMWVFLLLTAALYRENFRGILILEFSNLSFLKLFRLVELLSKLTILQLSHVAECLSEVHFSDGELIVDDGTKGLCALHIIRKGQVKITFDVMSNSDDYSFNYASQKEDDAAQSGNEISAIRKEGSYFGEWALLVAVGDVVYAILTKEKFESVVGPLSNLSQDDQKRKNTPQNLSISLPKLWIFQLFQKLSSLIWSGKRVYIPRNTVKLG